MSTGKTIFNETWAQIVGYTLDELSPVSIKTWESFVHPDDFKKSAELLERHFAGELDYYDCECRMMHRDGHWVWIQDRGRVVTRTTDGKPVMMFGTHLDITDRKQVEEELRVKEQAMASSINAFVLADLVGKLTYVNPAFLRLWSYKHEDEVLGRSVLELWEQSERAATIINKLSEQGSYEGELVARRSDGKLFNIHLLATMVYAVNGKPQNMMASFIDITERKQAEEKIRYMSFHDSLTSLYNRRFLDEEMKRLDTERQLPISIIMADLNGLKLVNDTYGHSVGDKMLKSAADIIKESCREGDIIARWGGDEFVVLLPQTTKEEACKICKRISDKCSDTYVEDVLISMATGAASKDSIEVDIAKSLQEAEDYMYRHKLIESQSARSAVLNSLLKTLGAKSYETEAHTRRMQAIAFKIGEKLKLSDSELDRLGLLITLHDIGKINIPEEILTKKEALSQEEWEIMKKHSEIGYRIARATEEFSHVAKDIFAHHERWDGNGYPRGLNGKEIPLLARITAIANAYEVMTNGRPYKKAMPKEEVVAELKRCAGTQFDPELVEAFLLVLKTEK